MPDTWNLSRRARSENDIVVASIFVNPLQFGANEDLSKYPRDLERDSAMLPQGGVDYLFAPTSADMYPRPMETVVDVPTLGAELEGAVRPGHFAGVATVVTKLFNIVQPDRAYFGEKDFQQVAIIRRMVEDLAQPVDVIAVPTVRDIDGLALLLAQQLSDADGARRRRDRAARARRSRTALCGGRRDPAALESRASPFHRRASRWRQPKWSRCAIPQTLKPVAATGDRPILVALFVRIGTTRLLDNRVIGQTNDSKRKGGLT